MKIETMPRLIQNAYKIKVEGEPENGSSVRQNGAGNIFRKDCDSERIYYGYMTVGHNGIEDLSNG